MEKFVSDGPLTSRLAKGLAEHLKSSPTPLLSANVRLSSKLLGLLCQALSDESTLLPTKGDVLASLCILTDEPDNIPSILQALDGDHVIPKFEFILAQAQHLDATLAPGLCNAIHHRLLNLFCKMYAAKGMRFTGKDLLEVTKTPEMAVRAVKAMLESKECDLEFISVLLLALSDLFCPDTYFSSSEMHTETIAVLTRRFSAKTALTAKRFIDENILSIAVERFRGVFGTEESGSDSFAASVRVFASLLFNLLLLNNMVSSKLRWHVKEHADVLVGSFLSPLLTSLVGRLAEAETERDAKDLGAVLRLVSLIGWKLPPVRRLLRQNNISSLVLALECLPRYPFLLVLVVVMNVLIDACCEEGGATKDAPGEHSSAVKRSPSPPEEDDEEDLPTLNAAQLQLISEFRAAVLRLTPEGRAYLQQRLQNVGTSETAGLWMDSSNRTFARLRFTVDPFYFDLETLPCSPGRLPNLPALGKGALVDLDRWQERRSKGFAKEEEEEEELDGNAVKTLSFEHKLAPDSPVKKEAPVVVVTPVTAVPIRGKAPHHLPPLTGSVYRLPGSPPEQTELPDYVLCGLSKRVMSDPVLLPCGHCFDLDALLKSETEACPVCGDAFAGSNLVVDENRQREIREHEFRALLRRGAFF